MTAAGSAGAVTIFTNIMQTDLDTFGTATFAATTTDLGIFTHTFIFSTMGLNDASSSVVTIELKSGKKDIDFTSVKLDGYAFTQSGFDPSAETWDLTTALLTAGPHAIVLKGSVVSAGPSLKDAASYSGTLNISTVLPEPGTWGLMVVGFGGAGAMIRSRRRIARAV